MSGRHTLRLHRGDLNDPAKYSAYRRLIENVLGCGSLPKDQALGPWRSFAYFASDGCCVANVDAAVLPLVTDGERRDATGIRSVAVHPEWRGKGLFRALMSEALAWCDASGSDAVLLYTETPSLYRGFGFDSVPQHAFVGTAPTAIACAKARPLNPVKDAPLIRTALARRTPVSKQCALLTDPSLFLNKFAADDDLQIAYDEERDAVIVYEADEDLVTIVDVVARSIPPIDTILGALQLSPRRIKTLFPPDQLGWSGEPLLEDTGLMLRGAVPPAMTKPFMFPPTAEF